MEQSKAQKASIIFFRVVVGVIIFIFVFSAFTIGIIIGSQRGDIATAIMGVYQGKVLNRDTTPSYLLKDVDFGMYWQAWDIIKDKYYDKDVVKDTELFYGSMAGMVASLQDPYSVFLNPEVNEEFTDELSGKFEGIGAEIGIRKEQLTLIAPLPKTPAERAGLRSGDKIVAIDEYDTQGMSLDRAVNLIRGEKGTEVKLTIVRDSLEPEEITIVRDKIDIISVLGELKEPGVSYIKLSYFNEDTTSEFRRIVQEQLAHNPHTIILDLRGNPGGFLDVAVKVASAWFENKPVVLERFSDGSTVSYDAQGQASLAGLTTYVLVDEGSASASEIVAGALQDYELATIVGEQTFGKGSVQDLIPLPDDSSIKLTIAKWLTPDGNTIDQTGITPDIEVKRTVEDIDEDRDPQLDKVVEMIHGGESSN